MSASRRASISAWIEGGMVGTQKNFLCPRCGKIFFAWRPDTNEVDIATVFAAAA